MDDRQFGAGRSVVMEQSQNDIELCFFETEGSMQVTGGEFGDIGKRVVLSRQARHRWRTDHRTAHGDACGLKT